MTNWAIRMPRSTANDSRAKIHKNNVYFAAIVGIDGARRIENGDAVARGEARARPHLAFGPGGSAIAMPVGIEARSPGAIDDRRVGRHRGDADRARPRRRSDRPAAADRRRAAAASSAPSIRSSPASPLSACAIRAISAAATASLLCGGQDFDAVRGDQMHGVACRRPSRRTPPTRRWRRSSRSPCARASPWRSRPHSGFPRRSRSPARAARACAARRWRGCRGSRPAPARAFLPASS